MHSFITRIILIRNALLGRLKFETALKQILLLFTHKICRYLLHHLKEELLDEIQTQAYQNLLMHLK